MQLQELQKIITDLANKKGWGNKPNEVIFSEKIALLHGEVAELLEAYRFRRLKGRDSLGEEMADIIVRTLHIASIYKVDIEKEITKKLKINNGRDWSKDQLYLDRDARAKRKKAT